MSIVKADRTLVMGIVNVTPDSFSDGGEYFDPERAVDHACALVAEGADLIDIGGESTRPGSDRAEASQERERVVPVVEALSQAGVVVSVDTMRADVARATVEAGAAMINDVSGGLADPNMLRTVAELKVPYVAMHWRGHSATMMEQQNMHYDDLVVDVVRELRERVDAAVRAGIDPDNIILDPGIGFSKNSAQNWEILRNLEALGALGLPLLLGVSRKRFLGELLAEGQVDRPAKRRDDASAAITVLAAQYGLWGVRTHSVRQHRDAIEVVQALKVQQPAWM